MSYTVNEAIDYLKKLQSIGYGNKLKVDITYPVTVSNIPSDNLNHICIYKNNDDTDYSNM